MIRLFHNGRAVIHHGDSRDVLRMMPDASVDSIVTDPPYALVSIVKRFGAQDAAPGRDSRGESGPYTRASAGFMGQTWDTGETAFAVEFWAQCLRVLKPGGHLIAFSGTRTYHRLACAIEDAGFEIRDQLAWCYGTGFPKSHDVSKGIAKRRTEDVEPIRRVCRFLRAAMDNAGLKSRNLTAHFGDCNPRLIDHWAARDTDSQPALPTVDQWEALCAVLDLPSQDGFAFFDGEVARLNDRKGTRGAAWTEAEIVGEVDCASPGFGDHRFTGDRSVRALEDEAAQWAGWGSGLKPAWEPIALGRKPLIGTIAENVLAHGTGAINIDACRVGDDLLAAVTAGQARIGTFERGVMVAPERLGRHPANILHDGSAEVSAAFGFYANGVERFFYSAKADKIDRAGSGHPTVKPVDVMRWCVRLVTPPGGTVLEPFAGSGTTAEACLHEGFRCIAIEREAKFFDDTCARVDAWRQLPADRRDRADYVRAEAEAAARAALYDGALL